MSKQLFEMFQPEGNKGGEGEKKPDTGRPAAARDEAAAAPAAAAASPKPGAAASGAAPGEPVITLGYTGVTVALALFALFGLAGFFLGRQTVMRSQGAQQALPEPAVMQWRILAATHNVEERDQIARDLNELRSHGFSAPANAERTTDQKKIDIVVGPYGPDARAALDADFKTISALEQAGRRLFPKSKKEQAPVAGR
jgi:hypothetical protein